MVLTPIVFGTLVYLIAYIVSNRLQLRFYIKIIIGLVILQITYLQTAHYTFNTLPNRGFGNSTFGEYYQSFFDLDAWYLRTIATLLYTW